MYNKHVSRSGEESIICEMEDCHLINTIYLYLRDLKQLIQTIDCKNNISDYQKELYGYQNITPKKAALITKEISNKLSFYILEGFLRDILTSDIRDLIREAFGRKDKYTKIYNNFLLEKRIDNDYNDDNNSTFEE